MPRSGIPVGITFLPVSDIMFIKKFRTKITYVWCFLEWKPLHFQLQVWKALHSRSTVKKIKKIILKRRKNSHWICFEYCFSAKKIINKEELPTFYAAAIAFGGRGMRTLYVLTGTLDADIYTGQSTGNTAQPPAGQLIIIRGLGKGKKGVKNHCVLCWSASKLATSSEWL